MVDCVIWNIEYTEISKILIKIIELTTKIFLRFFNQARKGLFSLLCSFDQTDPKLRGYNGICTNLYCSAIS